MIARAGAVIERMIEEEVEKRVAAVKPVDAAAVPVDERQAAIAILSDLLQRVARILPSERRRYRREIEATLRDVGVLPERRQAGPRS